MRSMQNKNFPPKADQPRAKKLIFLALIFLGIFGMAGSAWAADCTHYVNDKGNVASNKADEGSVAWSNARNIATPSSAGTAMARAIAGDTVCFRGGTYNVGPDGGGGYTGSLNPANSGSSGAGYITFRNYSGEIPIINSDCGYTYGACRTIGTSDANRNYIIFDGLTLSDSTGSGSIMIGTSAFAPHNDHITVQNMTIMGRSNADGANDNYDGIRLNSNTNFIVKNNKVYGFRRLDGGGSPQNYSAIKIYGYSDGIIENNELYDSGSGISAKRPTSNLVIRYNYIHDVTDGIRFAINTGVTYGSDTVDIYHNVINMNNVAHGAIGIDDDSGQYMNSNFSIYNNTFYNPNGPWGGIGHATNFKYYNNISVTTKLNNDPWNWAMSNNGPVTISLAEANHNQWGTGVFYNRMRRNGGPTASYDSLAFWQNSTELIGGGHPGIGDLTSDPKFANGSGNYLQLSDFNLQPDSPCKGTGRDGVDMGANISMVGVQGEPQLDATPPASPTGLSVN